MRKQIEIPTNCPSCNSILELVNAQLFCRNIKCGARASKNVEHFAKVIGIKGLGPSSIEKLGIQHFIELYQLTLEEIIDSIGSEKVGNKLYDQIQNSKTAEFCTIITAFGIPRLGKTESQKLSSIRSIDDLTKERCLQVGLGEVSSNSLMNFLNTEYREIKEFLPFPQLYGNNAVSKPKVQAKGLVCITGKLKSFKSKADAKVKLESLGFSVSDNLTKSVTHLVDEENKGSTKRVKAEEMGIEVIDNLINFIEKEESL